MATPQILANAIALADVFPPALAEVKGWPVLQLIQTIEAHRAALRPAQEILLYLHWLEDAPPEQRYVAHFNLGALYQGEGQRDEAEHHYRQALQRVELPEARYNLGLLLEQDGRLHEAMAEWRRLSERPPATPQAQPISLMAVNALVRVARRTGQEQALKHHLQKSLSLNPDQPALARELAQLGSERTAANEVPAQPTGAVSPGGAAERPAAAAPVIYVVAVCFNEATILPFFLDHYINFVGASRIFLHDGGSTDGTAEIVARYPQVELVVKVSEKLDDRELMAIRNEEWKKYRQDCDWMIVCDVDEFLYHPQLREKLNEFKAQGITLPMVEGFEMLSKQLPPPQPGRYLWQDIQTGFPVPRYYNKNLVFDPAIEINYLLGCHSCDPKGPVKRSEGFVFKNLHYRMLSYEHIVQKSRRAAARLSDWNKQTNAGFHYRHHAEMQRGEYNKMFVQGYNVVEPKDRPLLRREGFERLLTHMQGCDGYLTIAELGLARGFDTAADSGSTEFLAWYVDAFGGSLTSVDADPRAQRHAQRALQARRLGQPRVSVADNAQGLRQQLQGKRIDVLFIGDADYWGGDEDLQASARRALNDFIDIEPLLADDAVIALDGVLDEHSFAGKFHLLAAYLLGRHHAVQHGGHLSLFSTSTLRSFQ